MKPKQFFFVMLGIAAVILLAGGGGYYLAMTLLNGQAKTLSQRLGEQKMAGQQIDSLEALQRKYNKDIVPVLPYIDDALPRNKKQTEILAQIQTIARGSGLFVDSVSMPSPLGLPSEVSQTIKAGTVLALPISFQVRGRYDQLQSFTQHIEALNRFTNVTTLAISHEDKSQPTTYSFSLNAYIKP